MSSDAGVVGGSLSCSEATGESDSSVRVGFQSSRGDEMASAPYLGFHSPAALFNAVRT